MIIYKAFLTEINLMKYLYHLQKENIYYWDDQSKKKNQIKLLDKQRVVFILFINNNLRRSLDIKKETFILKKNYKDYVYYILLAAASLASIRSLFQGLGKDRKMVLKSKITLSIQSFPKMENSIVTV